MYYYTRIVDGAKLNAAPSLDYVQSFHENALAKAEGVGIGTAIEPSDEGDNTTLQHVTIHSDYTHVTWGDLAPKVDGSERWTIKELKTPVKKWRNIIANIDRGCTVNISTKRYQGLFDVGKQA